MEFLLNGLQESMLCLNNIALHGVLLNGLQENMLCLNNIYSIAWSSVEWLARTYAVLE